MRIPIPTEAEEQTTLFKWAEVMRKKWPELSLLFAIPNGGSRHPIEAVHLKAQGVKAGVPDIFLPCARGGYHGLFIEMKRRKGGRVSAEQIGMINKLTEQGYCVEVCFGWEHARDVIEAYMEGSRTNELR